MGRRELHKAHLFTYKTRSHVSQAGFKLTLLWKEFTLTCCLILQLMERFNCQSDTIYTVTWEESWSVGDLLTTLTHVGRPSPSRTAPFSR